MKLKIVLLALIGAAGATSSFALADSGHHGREHAKKDQACKRAAVFGTAAPQSFTVTVAHAGRHSSFHNGDVVTVSLGAKGQTVAVSGMGCADGSTFQAGTALLHVRMVKAPRTTTPTTTVATTTGDRGKGHPHPRGTTTTSTTTTPTTTTVETTAPETTTSDTPTTDAPTTTEGGNL